MVRRALLFSQVMLFVGLVSSGLLASSEPQREPVLVYLQAKITDHINLDVTEDRLRRLLPTLEKYRNNHPEAHVSATLMFSGAASEALAWRNGQTHILDFVKEYIQRGVVEVGYDGADEPTYDTRPLLDLSGAQTPHDRWMIRQEAAKEILTGGRDPLTGAPIIGRTGGLAKMQEIFGEAAYVSGTEAMVGFRPVGIRTTAQVTPAGLKAVSPTAALVQPTLVPEIGADTETAYEILRINTKAILRGLPEDNPAKLPGFGGSEFGFGKVLSPSTETSPEVYWQDNVLRLSEVSNTSEAAAEADQDFKGLTSDELKEDFGDLNRSRVQVVRVDLADERYYLRHDLTKDDDYTLKYAYSHPDDPMLPADSLLGKTEVNAAFEREDAALRWLLEEFLPANPGSRFVSNARLKEMAGPSTGYSVSVATLQTAVSEALERWGNNTFPLQYLRVGDHYLSLADWFQVMADALAEKDRTGRLPESVQLVPVYGPDHTPASHGPNVGEVSAASVAHVCSDVVQRLHDAGGDPPKNSVPTSMTVDGINMSGAQFLRLMAAALVANSPDVKLKVKMTYLIPEQGTLVPKTRSLLEMGASWTIKPAQLQIGGISQATQAKR